MSRSKVSVTIHDVARAAGVSVSTVSRVLNDKDDVASQTYERVQQVIEQLGYTSSLAAKSMRSRKTGVLGLVISNVREPFNMQVIRGVNRAVDQFGYDLMIYTGQNKSEKAREAWEQHQVSRLNGSLTDGLIISTPMATTFPTAFPLVAVDPHSEGGDYPAVIATNHIGALAMMEHLIDLGHRRIGFIGGLPYLQSSIRRLQGYKDGLQRANIQVEPGLIETGNFTEQAGYDCAGRLLSLATPPTAIFGANDSTAIGVIKAGLDRGLRIPDDLSVAGFDNVPEAISMIPPLTTVDQSIEQMGYLATEMLVKLVQGESLAEELRKVPTELIIRESCRAIKAI